MSQTRVSLKPSDFVHLHNHTQYSLLDGLTKVPALVKHVKQLGMRAVAITDHGFMSGALEFYRAAKADGLKPVIGMEAYVAPRQHTDKDPSYDRQQYHLTILAMNKQGYRNLMHLSSIANLEGFYYRPRVDKKLLEQYSSGIIVLSGCIQSEVSDLLRQGQYQKAKAVAKWYQKVFGDRYYLEIQDHGHESHPSFWKDQNQVNKGLLQLAKELGIEAVVTCDAHYLKKDDQEAHEVLLCIQTSAFLEEENRLSLKEFELHVSDPQEIIKRWGGKYPKLISNTRRIADRCNLQLELGKILIPKFPVPAGETEKSFLEKQVWRGLAWRYGQKSRAEVVKLSPAAAKNFLSKEVIKRAEYELAIINKMAFNGFYLIVSDFINWGKDQGIVFGPGRGSAASSILAYGLRVTEIDPLKYDLLFERFLNPDRISMPDMDIDIQDNRRDEVINYCVAKYGHDRVANIVTFGRMAARNSVRDVARVLQVPYAEADRLAKMIPPPIQGRHTALADHLKQVPELAFENQNNQQAKQVFDLATKLEGTIRSHGVHAAGVVIAPDDIIKFAPLEMAQKGVIATQYSMVPIEDIGFLKIDFLGLSNLTTIKNSLRIIKKVHGQDIDIDRLPLDDKKTFSLLQRGETTGVFQLESPGMRRYLKQLKPTVLEDIIAMVALYRPGPMQWIDDFIARKHGLRKIEYLHPVMRSALENTYGVIVYQEQVMQISKDLCGFSGGQADTLRKGIAKKNPDVLAKMKKEFIDGGVKHSKADRQLMERFWRQLEDFAAYCFNKVHSACYALIAYQTAYLKAHYPAAFMAALMTSDYDNTDRLAIEITECKKMGIEVLPPDVNESFHEFAVVPSKAAGQARIRFGMDAVKNVGHGAVDEILRARQGLGGKFSSLEKFLKNVSSQMVNRKALESLIKAGALDRFASRSNLLNNLDNLLSFASRVQKNLQTGQVDLFSKSPLEAGLSPKLRLDNTQLEIPESQLLHWERDLLGLYLSQHPLEAYQDILSSQTQSIASLTKAMENRLVSVGGAITAAREIITKNGAKMAFIKVADSTGELEVVVFPNSYQQNPGIWQRDQIVIVSGRLSTRGRDDELKILAEEARLITEPAIPDSPEAAVGETEAQPKTVDTHAETEASARGNTVHQRLYIRLEDSQNQPLLITLKENLDNFQGDTEVVIVTGDSEDKQIIKLPQTISVNEESLRALAALFGPTNVVVK